MEANQKTMKSVYTVIDRGTGKSYWMKVGVGFVNNDGSINLKLDAMPVNGTLQVREYESQEDREARFRGRSSTSASDPITALA